MKINWKVRLKNKMFWMTFIPMFLVFIKQILALFGFEIQIEALSNQLVQIIETVFVLLGLLGIVVDPTTAGTSDSALALTYEKPKKDDVVL